eukprot:2730707-Prymnesium_polylepis.1
MGVRKNVIGHAITPVPCLSKRLEHANARRPRYPHLRFVKDGQQNAKTYLRHAWWRRLGWPAVVCRRVGLHLAARSPARRPLAAGRMAWRPGAHSHQPLLIVRIVYKCV